MKATTSPLLTDLYQINMIQAYLDHGDADTTVLRDFLAGALVRPAFRRELALSLIGLPSNQQAL